MLHISVAPVTVWPGCKPFFLFSKPEFLSFDSDSSSWDYIVVETKEKDPVNLFELSVLLKELSIEVEETGNPYFYTVCVLGEKDEANEVFWYLDSSLVGTAGVNLYPESSDKKDEESVFTFQLPELGSSELFSSIIGKEHNN